MTQGVDELLALYGDPMKSDFERQWIASFTLPYALVFNSAMIWTARCHRLVITTFQAVFAAIKADGLCDAASEYGGIYANRSIRGFPGHLSAHAYGLAIDLNPTAFPLGSAKNQDPRVTAIFKAHGFAYGGDFLSRKDPMHYSLTGW